MARNDEGDGPWSNTGSGITTPEVYFYPTSGDLVSGSVGRSCSEGLADLAENDTWIWECLDEAVPDGDESMITLANEGVIWLGFTVDSGDVPGTVTTVWFEVSMATNKINEATIEAGAYGFTVFEETEDETGTVRTEVDTVSGPQDVDEEYVDVKVESEDITSGLSDSLNQAQIQIEAPASPYMQVTRVRMVVQYEID